MLTLEGLTDLLLRYNAGREEADVRWPVPGDRTKAYLLVADDASCALVSRQRNPLFAFKNPYLLWVFLNEQIGVRSDINRETASCQK